MEFRRLVLYFALAFIAFTLWTTWLKDYGPQPAPVTAETTANSEVPAAPATASNTPTASGVPAAPSATVQQSTQVNNTAIPANRIVDVHTDVLNVKIDTLGGNVIETSLPAYPAEIKSQAPVVLLNTNPDTYYVAQSGISSPQGPDTQKGQAQYSVAQKSYTLAPDQNELEVPLTWRNKQGVIVNKIYKFNRNDYAIHVNYQIKNNTSAPWSGNIYAQIKRKAQKKSSLFHLNTYSGAAISSAEKPYQKISYSKMNEENLAQNIHGGWLAMQERYFLSAYIPNQQQTNHYYSNVDANNIYTIGFIGPAITVAPKNEFNATTTLYVGPEIEDRLKALAPGLDLTIDYGWLWIFSVAILWVMQHIYNVIGNWGWAIVIVTLLIKLLFFKLSEASYRSMAKMRQLQPKLEELKRRHGDDKQKMSQATMELYRKEKVNPLGGCLPILIQIPVFIALYYVLIESVQLRQAPFIFWIHDLSAKDPYFILPILMGISMYFQQRLNPAPPDPMQARVMQFLPVVFTVFFLTFPSGLVLYWLTNNVLSILQQWHITRKLEQKVVEAFEKQKKKR